MDTFASLLKSEKAKMQKCKENAKHEKKIKITITYTFFKLQS